MRRAFCVILSICIVMAFIPGVAFAAQTVRVEDGARMREQPSTDAKAICKLDANCKVTLIEKVGDWYKLSYKGMEGYVHKSLVTVKGGASVPQADSSSSAQAGAQPAAAISVKGQLQRGDQGAEVEALQAALKQLGYFNEEVTGLFGRLTQLSVKAFQQANGLTADGVAGKATIKKLEKGSAAASSAVAAPAVNTAQSAPAQAAYAPANVSASEIRPGDVGKAVKSLQQTLANIGLFSERIDGAYGEKTEKAVMTFQEMNGLKPDGVAGQATLERLGLLSANTSAQASASQPKRDDALENTSYSPPAVQSGSGGMPSNVELLDWFGGGKEAFVKKARARIYDVRTGVVYYVSSFSNGSHADVEPITAEDTAIIKATYGGKWAWDPRPVIVTVNGRSFAAAINGQPHGGQTNHDNNMDGQLCIHLLNSKTHNGNKEYEKDMQDAVKEAWRATGH